MLGPAEVIRRIYGELYDYMLSALPDLTPMVPMHLARESNIGAQVGLTYYAEHAPEVVPREEAEAGAPDPVASEATF